MKIAHLKEGISQTTSRKRSFIDKDNVLVGIEYEFYISKGMSLLNATDTEKHFKKNYPNIRYSEIKYEHGGQVELVTNPMPIQNALKHLKTMLSEYNKNVDGIEMGSSEVSALQLSMSYTDKNKDTFNPLKFAVLMDSDYIHRLFPERDMVKNYNSHITDTMQDILSSTPDISFQELKREMETVFKKYTLPDTQKSDKYYTFKISDFGSSKERIELRFVGGEDYETMLDSITDQLSRALMLLEIAYTSAYETEYTKKLYKLFSQL